MSTDSQLNSEKDCNQRIKSPEKLSEMESAVADLKIADKPRIDVDNPRIDVDNPRTDVDWSGFQCWVHSVAVVTFDLELGQVIEKTFPNTAEFNAGSDKLSEQDKTNICYLSFPDSNSGIMGDIQFHFRIRRSPGGHSIPPGKVTKVFSNYNSRVLPPLQLDTNFLFGFAYFRQVKDSSIRRGYYQKSVILLTYLPCVSLFSHLSAIVAKKFFETGDLPLEVFCHDVERWPPPIPGQHLTLPLLGSIIELHIPSLSSRHTDNSNETVTVNSTSIGMSSAVLGTDLFPVLFPLLEQLHCIWELVLTADPLVVLSRCPAQCSATVQALTSIIHPLRYVADYRPFYTIHDTDFKELTSSNTSALPSIILGVTNPFFNKALQHWPNQIRLGFSGEGGTAAPAANGGVPGGKGSKMKRSTSTKFEKESKPGVFTQSKPNLDRDKDIIKRIYKGVQLKRPAEVQSALLRRYFLELTQTFLIPLERYLAGLMPLARTISPYRAPPKVRPFNVDEFISSLDQSGPQLTSRTKGDWAGLYRRFLKSPNFVGWYNARHGEVTKKLTLLHLESLAEAKIEIWMSGKAEVELVDMVLRIRGKLSEVERTCLPISDLVKERLLGHVAKIVSTLPEDLQSVIETKS